MPGFPISPGRPADLGISLGTDDRHVGPDRPGSGLSHTESVDVTQPRAWANTSTDSLNMYHFPPDGDYFENASHNTEGQDTFVGNDARAWASTSTLPLDDDKSSLDIGLGDVFDTFHLSRSEINSESARISEGPNRWREYLPIEGLGESPPVNELPNGDEENMPSEKPKALKFVNMLQKVKESSKITLNQARKRRERRRERVDNNDDWLPMREPSNMSDDKEPSLSPLPVHMCLRGKSLTIFGPRHPWRVYLAKILSSWWIEPLLLFLIFINVVVLIVSSSRDIRFETRTRNVFSRAEEILLLVVFIAYTIEMIARIIVSGLVINPPSLDENVMREGGPEEELEYSNTYDVLYNMYLDALQSAHRFLHPYSKVERERAEAKLASFHPAEGMAPLDDMFISKVENGLDLNNGHQRWWDVLYYNIVSICLHLSRTITTDPKQLCNHAYLRQSWNRVDALAILCYWVAVGLEISGVEVTEKHHIFVFRALSVLRCARLLGLWEGTETILRSLKRVAPLLLRVLCFLVFAMVLFAVIGIQSFHGSYLRRCVWLGDYNNSPGVNYTLSQICGGSVDPNDRSKTISHLNDHGAYDPARKPNGFICPYGQVCMEQDMNPFNNVQSFDDVFHSLLQVAVIVSLNGWSDTMYDMVDADYYTAIIFFIIGIILLNFWLANLFVAVISHSFASLSAQTERSAFAARDFRQEQEGVQEASQEPRRRRNRLVTWYKKIRKYTQYIWLSLIIVGLAVQGSKASYEFEDQKKWREDVERYLVIPFDLEILVRFIFESMEGGPGQFFQGKRNVLDLFLAIITTIIQIPVVNNSSWYPWLTFFQLLRFYRVIAAIPRMKSLLLRVVGSMSALFNTIAFLVMTIFLAALMSVQLFRGDIEQSDDGTESDTFTWKQLFNGFLGVYQIFSSEGWKDLMFNVISSTKQYKQGVIAGMFIVGWFLFANLILLQLFVAVINENFRVAEGDKYKKQMENYLRRTEPPQESLVARLMQRLSPFRVPHEHNTLSHRLEGPVLDDARQHADTSKANYVEERPLRSMFMQLVTPDHAGLAFGTLRRVLRLDKPHEHARLEALRRQSSGGKQSQTMDELEDMINNQQDIRALGSEHVRIMRTDLGLVNQEEGQEFLKDYVTRNELDPRIRMARLMAEHPSYDRSWFIFSNRNPIRRFCQSLTRTSHGERVFGRPMSKFRNHIFQAIVFGAIIGSVVLAGIATPAYRKKYMAEHRSVFYAWYAVIEVSLSLIFVLEFFIKTIADGFIFTPNAYLYNMWNLLDLFVLISLLINVISELIVPGGVSHFTRALKAFRALRLINVSSLMRDTFHAVMIAGAGYILDASILALLYIIPYAVWGQNLFAGLMYSCTDTSDSIVTKLDCHGEYRSQPLNWSYLAPRAWTNPTEGSMYSFDDFKSALLILFEIVSLEGWIDVMQRAMSIRGRDMQPRADAAQHNAIFFLVYNLIGAVSVLTLFVSVIIENFQRYSGAAYLTTEQRQWLDMKRQLQRQGPSKRPRIPSSNPFIRWCFQVSTRKRGWWSRFMGLLYFIVLILLMTQSAHDTWTTERGRAIAYVVLGFVFVCDIIIRLLGLGFTSFRRSYWNWYDVIIMGGVIGTSLSHVLMPSASHAHAQLQKLFVTAITLKLIQRSDSLDLLFKTAVGSVPAIIALFLLWLTMFLVWGIMLVEVFGLTKWGINESHAKNLSSLWQTLIFLSMTSTGEGWNQYMHDYAVQPPMCTPSKNYLESDCGSIAWSYFLFISWNIISMFIFLNMFTGTVVENFSYVYHLQGSSALSRDQMRIYKDIWSQFDPQGHGYISQQHIIPFLSRLTGMFEVRLYPSDLSVSSLLDHSRVSSPMYKKSASTSSLRLGRRSPRSSRSPKSPRSPRSPRTPQSPRSPNLAHSDMLEPVNATDGMISFHDASSTEDVQSTSRIVSGIDLDALSEALDSANVQELRMRRQRLNRMYYEAILADKGKGVSFSTMLFILAYYKMCGSPVNMEVSEFIERRELMNKIDSRINLERVRGLLRGVYLRRRFLAVRAERERQSVMHLFSSDQSRGFPSITVERPISEAHQHDRQRPNIRVETNLSDSSPLYGDALHMPSPRSPSGYVSSDDGDSGNASDVQVSPLSVAVPRRRLSFQNYDENPFEDARSHNANISSSHLHAPLEMDTWTQIMHRLSTSTHDDSEDHMHHNT